jgi:hypothetical protein
MPTNCQTDISETVMSAVDSSPSQGAKRKPRPNVCRNLGDAPERRENQLPGEADDDDRQHGRHEDQRAVGGAKAKARQAEQGGEHQADGVLHGHVNQEEQAVVPEGVPERNRPGRVGQQRAEIAETDEDKAVVGLAQVKRIEDRGDQRIDREQRVDENGGSKKEGQHAQIISARHADDAGLRSRCQGSRPRKKGPLLFLFQRPRCR